MTTPQEIFDNYLKELHKVVKTVVHNKEQSIILAEAMMVTVKELLEAQGFAVDHSLLFIEHALQELEENNPTIH